ncbi:MAG: redoxin domain-containing protein, partial [bacterium]
MTCRSARWLLPRLMTALVLAGFFLFSVSGAAAAFKNIKVGDQALPVELEDLEGTTRSLADYRDAKAVLLFFWATWSERSLKEMEDLEKLEGQYADKGLRIVAVNVENQTMDSQDMDKIRNAMEGREIGFPVLIDRGLETYNEWGVIATPTTALIDESGTVVFDLSSYPTSGYMDLEAAVQKALGLYVEEAAVEAKPAYQPNRQAMLHFGLGKRHLDKGFVTKAIPEFEKAAQADSRFPDPPIYLGLAYLRADRTGDAEQILESAGGLAPDRPEPLLLLAHIRVGQNRLDEAIEMLQGMVPEASPEGDQAVTTPGEPAVAGTLQAAKASPEGGSGSGALDITE